MILLIDNYDSFSYNLYQMAGSIDRQIQVVRNDAVTTEEIEKLNPNKIIISPGPGRPENAGICMEVIREFAGKIPLLGICLGHQAICTAFGAEVSYARELKHGKQDEIILNNKCYIFRNLPPSILAARYHSLAAVESTMPECLEITARAEDGEIMAVKHREFEVYGLQFHPESIMTPQGIKILENFMRVHQQQNEKS